MRADLDHMHQMILSTAICVDNFSDTELISCHLARAIF